MKKENSAIKEDLFTIFITAMASAGMTFMSFTLALAGGVIDKFILKRH
jgi:hypothetical protein